MPTIRDNVVILRGAEIKSVSFLPDSPVVSSGQPSQWPPGLNHHQDVVTILFKAGRHKTSAVAAAFNAKAGGRGHEYAPQGGDGGTPKELNFFFGVSIEWKEGGKSDVYLGQGSNLSHNNWWIGSPSISTEGSAQLAMPSGEKLKITGATPAFDAGEAVKSAGDALPENYKGLGMLLQLAGPLLTEITRQVNEFRFAR